jgi:hypothetical protein
MFAKWIEADNAFSFSPTNNGGVEIDDDFYVRLLAENSEGRGVIGRSDEGLPIIIDISTSLSELCADVDSIADGVRKSIAGDSLRAVERDLAAQEAKAFKLSGYPPDAVPRAVSAWAIYGRTAQEAADSIISEAEAYTESLYGLREARLEAKERIRALWADGSLDQAKAARDEALSRIRGLQINNESA